MNRTLNRISGIDKAAILLQSLAPETTAKVMEYLTVEERSKIAINIESMRSVDTISRRMVIDEVTKHIRESKRNREAESNHASKCKPMVWMEELDPARVAEALNQERPQSAAMVLSVLSPQYSAKVLAQLSEKMRNQVVMRLATLKPVSEKALIAIDEAMRAKLLGSGRNLANAEPDIRPLSRILDSAADNIRVGITSNQTPDPSSSIVQTISKYTSLDQMLGLSDAEMFEVLARMRMDDLIAVLRIARDDLKLKVMRNVSPDSARILKKALRSDSQTTLREIEEANRRVLGVLNSWSETYKVSMKTAA